jgi:uncharacterized membrane protein YozB (DUF420 family)
MRYIRLVYGLTTLYEYLLFTFFIGFNIFNKNFRKFILIASTLFISFLIIYYSSANFKRLDSLPIGIESILILIFASYFFYEQISNPQILFIYNDYRFWIITGIMIYISGSFFIYIFANQIPNNELDLYWSFTYIFLGIMNILFSVGIIVLGLKPKQKHHTKPKANHHYLDITWCFYCRPQILPESHLYSS